jgi:hypothetical protein
MLPMLAPGPTRERRLRRPAEHTPRRLAPRRRGHPVGPSWAWTGELRSALPVRDGGRVWRLLALVPTVGGLHGGPAGAASARETDPFLADS